MLKYRLKQEIILLLGIWKKNTGKLYCGNSLRSDKLCKHFSMRFVTQKESFLHLPDRDKPEVADDIHQLLSGLHQNTGVWPF